MEGHCNEKKEEGWVIESIKEVPWVNIFFVEILSGKEKA